MGLRVSARSRHSNQLKHNPSTTSLDRADGKGHQRYSEFSTGGRSACGEIVVVVKTRKPEQMKPSLVSHGRVPAAAAGTAPSRHRFVRLLVAFILSFFALSTAARAADAGVLVLGGTGQLGSEIVKALVAAGENVSVLARQTSNRSRLDGVRVSYVIGDMLTEVDIERVFKEKSYRAVVDASNAPFNGSQDFYENSQRIVSKWAAATGVRQLILHGAIGAGDSAALIYVEKAFEIQRKAIASKTVAEEIVVASGVPYTIIRHLTLLPMQFKESGQAKLSRDRNAVGAVTRDGLARLTRECLDNSSCMNVIFHAVDEQLVLPDRVRENWKNVIRPEYMPKTAKP
jgi:uncharacterized protein YbjT (DUF2867 family)